MLNQPLVSKWVGESPSRSGPGALAMVGLNTAWEWLVDERLKAGDQAYRELSWIDPIAEEDEAVSADSSQEQQVWSHIPLYPIPAVYLPVVGVNHTLNNVEPRNIQMAVDLMSKDDESDRLFCLALRVSDTGRIARVGSLMRLVGADTHHGTDDGSISRIVVTCEAVEPVKIEYLDNGSEAESRISKLMRSPIYLTASVSSRRPSAVSASEDALNEQVNQLSRDYAFVRSMYVDGVGQEEVPIFARENLGQALPEEWTSQMFSSDQGFWKAAYKWQRLCNTVREGRQLDLSADRNEIMIEAASKNEGPLKLPIHMEELPPKVQRELEQMEADRQKEFAFQCRMDPVLDFQVLLQQRTLQERIHHLSNMVARERRRLTESALFCGTIEARKSEIDEPPPKGAWFDEEF